jgi:penicillin-binding protein 1A
VEAIEGEIVKAMPLEVNLRRTKQETFSADYFTEEVRRELLEKYGETKLYGGGLSVRTSVDLKLQAMARRTLVDGLIEFDESKGWRGPLQNVELGADWAEPLLPIQPFSDVSEWDMAVVLDVTDQQATIGLRPKVDISGSLSDERITAAIPLAGVTWAKWADGPNKDKKITSTTDVLAVGDVVYAEKAAGDGNSYRLRQPPAVDGGLVAMDPHTGRVLAMVGGFSFASSQFNRATQARRQPGSSFKPFVYAAALDNGYTPSSVVMDAPISVNQGGNLGIWRPTNYGGKFYGPSTLRLGIEKSRNVMTVRLAKDMGMPLIAEYARRFGIYDDMLPVLSMALGAGETTLIRMVSAYAVLANGGRRINPTMIDRIQDRYGKTIFMHDERICENCQTTEWNNQVEPVVADNRDQVLDPMTAYQITSMMEGVVIRGTAPVVRGLKRPVAGKTGTTNDELDAWFVGYTPDLVVGVFVGHDQPKPMGRGATGGSLAAPIFTKFMTKALKGQPKLKFRVPDGLNLIPINRRTGLRVIEGGNADVILEAFKPGTSPPDNLSIIGFEEDMGRAQSISLDEDRAVVTGTGGLY